MYKYDVYTCVCICICINVYHMCDYVCVYVYVYMYMLRATSTMSVSSSDGGPSRFPYRWPHHSLRWSLTILELEGRPISSD